MVLVSATPGQLGSGEAEDEHGVGPPMPPGVGAMISGPPPGSDAEMAAAMKDLLPAYGHFPWLEEPDRFFPLVREWLDAR